MNGIASAAKGMDRVLVAAWIVAATCGPAPAQTSASFELTETAIHAGGNPLDGDRPESASFRISHDAIGDGAAGRAAASSSYRSVGGFVVRYRPAEEVLEVRFTVRTSLSFRHDPSAGTYNVYRGALSSLPGGYGSCHGSGLAGPPFVETDAPAPGASWYYLVTAENLLRQEASKGRSSAGVERPNAEPCP
jgi:hypothetical protein